MLAGAAMGGNGGAALFLGGLVIGPSVGHVYAGQIGRGVGTAALRGLGAALALHSIVGCFND